MKRRYAVRVRRWRGSMSGSAWSTFYLSGRRSNWIECPYPRTPLSLAIFLHEIGHHAIGFDRFSPGCVEEHAVWSWTLAAMTAAGVEPDERVRQRVRQSMRHAVTQHLRQSDSDVLSDELLSMAA